MATGRRHDHETIEEKAARIIARTFGYGDAWPMAGNFEQAAAAFDDAGEDLALPDDAYQVIERGGAQQVASRALPRNPASWSEQLRALPPATQAEIAEWSRTHPLQAKRGHVGQLKRWRCIVGRVATLHGARFETCALAMTRKFSRLTRIEQDMLRVYALMDWRAAERVIRWTHDRGHDLDVAANALRYRILFPQARKLHHSTKERAKQLHVREIFYRDLEKDAADLLHRLLHEASVKFWHAFPSK